MSSTSGGRVEQDAPQFVIANFTKFERNSLRGFFDVELPSGLILRGCSLHIRGSSRWLGLPSKTFTKPDGSKGFTPTVEFTDRARAQDFRDRCIAALDKAGLLP
jgi:hypothetical protein